MERFIADLVRNFESGRINRRQFCEAVTLAATVYASGDAAKAHELLVAPDVADGAVVS